MEASTPPPNDDLSIYEQERREKLFKLRELGVDPYGARTEGLRPLADIKAEYKPEMGHDAGPIVKAAGRIMLKRDMGKLTFLTLRDDTGDLQIGLDKKRLSETHWKINELMDLGDLLVAEGPLGTTRKGEVTIWATGIAPAAKALLPPPGKWSGLSDVELRYRQRYVDMWANPEVMQLLKMRMRIVEEVRAYMQSQGYLEVETPMMQPLHGGAAARPFVTKHNALDMELYLRIAPELYLKRLLVGGFSKIFELNRNFRNEGISPRHNPEFTMLEAYEAFGSWETMADLVEGMVCHVAEKLFGGLKVKRPAKENEPEIIDLARPWRKIPMPKLVEERTGWKFDKRSAAQVHPPTVHLVALLRFTAPLTRLELLIDNGDEATLTSDVTEQVETLVRAQYPHRANDKDRWPRLLRVARQAYVTGVRAFNEMSPAEQLVEVYEKLIEPTLIDPCFVTHVPSVIIPLAKKNKDDPFFADVYELAINGQEISPGYTELNDPDIQAANFKEQVGDEAEKQKTDEDFLTALRYGMPPAGGMGLGIDRLVMMLTGAQSIRDIIAFPLMKPT